MTSIGTGELLSPGGSAISTTLLLSVSCALLNRASFQNKSSIIMSERSREFYNDNYWRGERRGR